MDCIGRLALLGSNFTTGRGLLGKEVGQCDWELQRGNRANREIASQHSG